jgi:DNA-binding response OmpR family regulator
LDPFDVLIIEDQPASREAMQRAVRRQGYRARVAGSLEEAIPALDPAPDCVILDLKLPDGDGEAILTKIRSEKIPVRIVAVVTGVSEFARLQDLKRLSPDLLLYKPVDPDVLFRLCKSVLER